MQFRIEYLKETTDEKSVCLVTNVRTESLNEAGKQAWDGKFEAKQIHGAGGFQIRDMGKGGEIVALETFD